MIRSIIFDFGGVLLDLDYSLSFKAVSDLLDISIQRYNMPENLNDVFEQYEMGKISKEALIKTSESICGKNIKEVDFINAWNAMLLGIPSHRVEFLKQLRKEYPIYLLSNTNQIHIEWVYRYLKKNLKNIDFEAQFNKVFYSHQIHMRKPNADIFKYVLSDLDILPEETLFIDDSPEHIHTAKSLGIQAVLHDPTTEIQDMLPQYLSQS